MFKITRFFFLVLSLTGKALGQSETDSFSIQNIKEIVITGEFEPQEAKRSVYQVKTISQEVIKAHSAVKLQDVLITEANIRFSQDLALGGSNLTMQGLSGQNVKILIDGVPMVGRQGASNEINLNQINVNGIQRIEIIEGPMSVIYGADALAGVINIITKKAVEGKADLYIRLQEETAGKEYGWPQGVHNQSVGGGYKKANWFFKADLARNAFGGWQGTAEGRDKQWHPKTQYAGNGTIGIETDKTTAHFRLDLMNEDIYNPNPVTANQAIDQNYLTGRWMNQLQFNHSFNTKLKLNTSLAFTHFQRKTQTTIFNHLTGDRRLSLAPGSQDTTVFDGLSARVLFPYRISSRLSLLSGLDINMESGQGGRIEAGTHSIRDYGLILSGEYHLTSRFQIRPGVRFTSNSVYNAPPVLPSINVKWSFDPKHDLRLAYGRGFRAPSLRELYFNFFDSNHSIIGNTDLEAELSHSFSGSWNWTIAANDHQKITSSLAGFYNSIDHMIGFGQRPDNPLVVTYINIDRFKTQGLTANAVWKKEPWSINLTGAYTGRFNQFNDDASTLDEFVWSPELSASFNYEFPRLGAMVSLFHKYTGKTPYFEVITEGTQQKINRAVLGSYSWSDLSLSKDFKSMALTLGVRNLFNVINISNSTQLNGGVHTGGNSQPIGYGRSFFINIQYTIIK